MARITISFKGTENDTELYEYWNSLEDKSVEIKNVLREEKKRREDRKKREASTNLDYEEKPTEKKERFNNILDF